MPSDDAPDELRIDEQPVPCSFIAERPPEPDLGLWRVMRDQCATRKETQKQADAAREALDAALAEFASEAFELERQLQRVADDLSAQGVDGEVLAPLRIVSDRCADLLAARSVACVDVTGQPLAAMNRRHRTIISSTSDPAAAEPVVAETVKPMVTRDGSVIQPAVVVVATPNAVEPEADTNQPNEYS